MKPWSNVFGSDLKWYASHSKPGSKYLRCISKAPYKILVVVSVDSTWKNFDCYYLLTATALFVEGNFYDRICVKMTWFGRFLYIDTTLSALEF